MQYTNVATNNPIIIRLNNSSPSLNTNNWPSPKLAYPERRLQLTRNITAIEATRKISVQRFNCRRLDIALNKLSRFEFVEGAYYYLSNIRNSSIND